ncbi:unnamed protein product [Symbiodinium microadriaticum]|nr:unnamed protein product [Symbiodinium sp. KB8]CAE7892582.1 unnamed protein product [Symbiodinium microadriaticum]
MRSPRPQGRSRRSRRWRRALRAGHVRWRCLRLRRLWLLQPPPQQPQHGGRPLGVETFQNL